MSFDPQSTLDGLTAGQRNRLLDIAKAEKALPWRRGDDRLLAISLIGKMTGPFDEPLASISRNGWTVLNFMERR